jgi:hypothetical protein
MKTLPQLAAELAVEQPTAGRREGVGPPTEADHGSTTAMEGDHVVGKKAECRPGSTWAERPH